jgi:hypothetical protein
VERYTPHDRGDVRGEPEDGSLRGDA